MDKNEILKKAQREGKDEMELQIKDKSMKWTYLTMVAAAAIFSFIRSEQGLPMMDLCATVCASVCVGNTYRYIRNRDGRYLVMALITLVVAVFAVIRFFMGH